MPENLEDIDVPLEGRKTIRHKLRKRRKICHQVRKERMQIKHPTHPHSML